jgi:hypothetical protein
VGEDVAEGEALAVAVVPGAGHADRRAAELSGTHLIADARSDPHREACVR